MYGCYNAARFFRLLALDAIIFGIIFAFVTVGKVFLHSSAEDQEEPVFLPVIMYHSISSLEKSEYNVTPEQIENDLKFLSQHGFKTVTAQELANYVFNGSTLPPKPVLITLDDGFLNNYTSLLPLLEKYDAFAIVSVVGSYIEARPDDGSFYPYLTWDNINVMLDSKRIEIGNHTYNMHSLNTERKGTKIMQGENSESYRSAVNEDISIMQQLIKENCGITPIAFAYPFGYCCKELVPVLKENGFLITLTCYERPNYIKRNADCLYELNRYNRSGLSSTEEFMTRALTS